MKNIIKIILVFIALLVFIVVTYVLYVSLTYYRIKDNVKLDISNNQNNTIDFNKEYKMLTYNISIAL